MRSFEEFTYPARKVRGVTWHYSNSSLCYARRRTAFLALGFLDKFFVDDNAVDKKKLQLIGATCLLIASKCEDVAYIGTKDLAFCGDNTYKENHLGELEVLV